MKEVIGLISGALIVVSLIPYAIRTWQGEIKPNTASWIIWTVMGLGLYLTYDSSGAKANAWPVLMGFFEPLTIVLIVLWRQGWVGKRMDKVDKTCLTLGAIAIVIWYFVRESQILSSYALYFTILVDSIGVFLTFRSVHKDPSEDRPYAWVMFTISYVLVMFAIEDHTFANWILPIYTLVSVVSIATPLIKYRIKNNIPLREWI